MKTQWRAICWSLFFAVCLFAATTGGVARHQDQSPTPSDDERVYTHREVDEKAVVDKSNPSFPSAKGCRGEGRVLLRVILHKSGKVTEVETRRGAKCKGYLERAIEAVRQVKFKPAKKGGVAVSQYAMFEYNYNVW